MTTAPRALRSALRLDLVQENRRAAHSRRKGPQTPRSAGPQFTEEDAGRFHSVVFAPDWLVLQPGSVTQTLSPPARAPTPPGPAPPSPSCHHRRVPFTPAFSTLGVHTGTRREP